MTRIKSNFRCTCAAGAPNATQQHLGVATAVLPHSPIGPNGLTTVKASDRRQCSCGCRIAEVGEWIEYHGGECDKGGEGWVLVHHVQELPDVAGIDPVPPAQQLELFA